MRRDPQPACRLTHEAPTDGGAVTDAACKPLRNRDARRPTKAFRVPDDAWATHQRAHEARPSKPSDATTVRSQPAVSTSARQAGSSAGTQTNFNLSGAAAGRPGGLREAPPRASAAQKCQATKQRGRARLDLYHPFPFKLAVVMPWMCCQCGWLSVGDWADAKTYMMCRHVGAWKALACGSSSDPLRGYTLGSDAFYNVCGDSISVSCGAK